MAARTRRDMYHGLLEAGAVVNTPPKYPRTPYWPYSPSTGAGDRLADAACFVGEPVVITEKLDGSCTLLHMGAVYARSVHAPTSAKWMAMVKKHHSWKVNEPDMFLYGEDIYGVHSIEYGPVPENETFYAFALRDNRDLFASFGSLVDYASPRNIPVAPVLFEGAFGSEAELRSFVEDAHRAPSALGGEREGVVIRLARSFLASEFQRSVCKSVRAGHVQTDEHWTRHWRPCRIGTPAASPRTDAVRHRVQPPAPTRSARRRTERRAR